MAVERHFSSAGAPEAKRDPRRIAPFDLTARAALAIQGIVDMTNPERGGQPYSYAEFHTEPPVALHSPWDYGDAAGRLLEALTLARIMTGSEPGETDQALSGVLAAHQRSDGLLFLPPDPWTCTAPVVEMEWTPRGALMAWLTRYLAADDVDARERAERLISALYREAVWGGDTAWYPYSYLPDTGWVDRHPPVDRMANVLIGAQIIFPLVRFAAAVGNQEARRLAHGLLHFLCQRSHAFDSEGRFTARAGRSLHSITTCIKGALTLGILDSRAEQIEWARHAYEYVRELGTDSGFFPHGTEGYERVQGDICALKDMIEIALLLGLHHDSDFFADAERFGRNHLLECQLLHFDWVHDRREAPFCQDLWCASHPAEAVTVENVCGRAVGTFASWSRMNDAFDPANPRLFLRSTGAGVRALYDLWHYAVLREGEAVRVNLHFSRDTRWATVTSLIPAEGGVDVLMKTHGVLAVRIPPGMTNEQVIVTVNQQRPRHEILRHGYAWIEALQNGDMVSVRWPLEERTATYKQEGVSFTGHWRGDTLMQIEPPGLLAPLYRRTQEVAPVLPGHTVGPLKEFPPI